MGQRRLSCSPELLHVGRSFLLSYVLAGAYGPWRRPRYGTGLQVNLKMHSGAQAPGRCCRVEDGSLVGAVEQPAPLGLGAVPAVAEMGSGLPEGQ